LESTALNQNSLATRKYTTVSRKDLNCGLILNMHKHIKRESPGRPTYSEAKMEEEVYDKWPAMYHTVTVHCKLC